jgi:CTD small phosphatase-like protein 2
LDEEGEYIKKPKNINFPQKDENDKLLTLVLDLDETLVHCSTEPLNGADFIFPVVFNNVTYKVTFYENNK